MKFSDIAGDRMNIRTALAGMVDSGRVPHALMFHEDDGGGAVPLAIAFLQYLMCSDRRQGDSCGSCPTCNKVSKLIHPDIHFLYPVTGGTAVADYAQQWRTLVTQEPSFTVNRMREAFGMEGKSPLIAVAQVKELLEKLSLNSLEGGYRCVVIYLPELMNADAGNRLLKLIEEPPLKTQFVLVTHAPEKVLVTIRSRCQCLRVLPLDFGGSRTVAEADSECSGLFDELMKALMGKNLFDALETAEAIAALPSRERQKGFCIFASEGFRRIFLLQQGMDNIAGIPAEEKEKYSDWAGKCRKTFARNALEAVSRANRLIERNVAPKIVFTDLVDRLILAV